MSANLTRENGFDTASSRHSEGAAGSCLWYGLKDGILSEYRLAEWLTDLRRFYLSYPGL